MSMKVSSERPSLSAVFGMHCALLSLASGVIALAVSLLLWWRFDRAGTVVHVAEQAEFFSATLGIALAAVGLVSPRKVTCRIAKVALGVNLIILIFLIDTVFRITPP